MLFIFILQLALRKIVNDSVGQIKKSGEELGWLSEQEKMDMRKEERKGSEVRRKNLFWREEAVLLRNSLALPSNPLKCSPLQSESHPSAVQQAVGQ